MNEEVNKKDLERLIRELLKAVVRASWYDMHSLAFSIFELTGRIMFMLYMQKYFNIDYDTISIWQELSPQGSYHIYHDFYTSRKCGILWYASAWSEELGSYARITSLLNSNVTVDEVNSYLSGTNLYFLPNWLNKKLVVDERLSTTPRPIGATFGVPIPVVRIDTYLYNDNTDVGGHVSVMYYVFIVELDLGVRMLYTFNNIIKQLYDHVFVNPEALMEALWKFNEYMDTLSDIDNIVKDC